MVLKKQISILYFSFFSCLAFSQCNMDYYESSISEQCENCSQSDLILFVNKICIQRDSILNAKINNLNLKLVESDKKKMKKEFNKILKNIRKNRQYNTRFFKKINENGSISDYMSGIIYWYYSNELIFIVEAFEANVFRR